ncbi:MAG: hypothetical protein FH756_00585 [Firmicutes bacterium]|nr:hypothetical protein [Bacillota bacterium]
MRSSNKHRIIQLMDVALDISVHITVYVGACSWDKAVELANEKLVAILKNDYMDIYSAGKYQRIDNKSKDKYKFEVCTKKLPKPVNVATLSNQEKEALLLDERYMTTFNDYRAVDWNINAVYKYLRNLYPDKSEFHLSSLAYRIEEL